MGLTCWVCRRAIEPGEAQVEGRALPRRLRRYEGQPLHLRCHGDWKDVVVPPHRPSQPVAPAPQPLRDAPPLLFAEDVARRLGMSSGRARRLLVRLERQYGPTIVGQAPGRRGPRRYTTEAALQSVAPRTRCETADLMASILERVVALEERFDTFQRQHR
jgi:hypothetical protein